MTRPNQPTQPTRRDFLKSSAAFAVGANIATPNRRKDKPSLLFLWTDEQRPDTMAVYGNKNIHAPNLNRLASESAVFRKSYCTQPVCTPSRSCIMTGLWPHQNGCVRNNVNLQPETRCFPEILDDSDYRTGYMGKWHLGDEVFAQHGFEEWESIEDGYGKYYTKAPGRDPQEISSYSRWLTELGYKSETERGNFRRGYCARLPIEHCKPSYLENRASDFLRRHREDPFILHVNYLEPHMPFYGPLDNEHSLDEVPLPENLEDELEDNEPLRYRLMREHYRTRGFEDNPLETAEDWRRLIGKYWGLVTQVDRSVGGILKTLEEQGLADNTIVVYTSDHGDMMGSHRLLAKTVSYEESVGIPWIIRDPRRGAAGQVIEHPVSQIDMVPTLLDLMGSSVDRSAFSGNSLSPVMEGEAPERDHVFIQWNAMEKFLKPEQTPPGLSMEEMERAFASNWRMAISPEGWKLTLADTDKSQLFNLNDDPYEKTNLFDSGGHGEVIASLSEKIRGWQESVGDTVRV